MPFPNPQRVLVLLAVLASASGCELERTVIHDPWDQFRQWEWYSESGTVEGTQAGPNRKRYAIQLGSFRGADAFGRVYRLITTARQKAGLADLWYTSTGQEAVVYAGRFADPEGADARAALRRIRAAEIDGETVFEDAEVVAVAGNRNEVLDPRDLRTLSGRGLYALQIGYYDGSFGPDFRKAAETAVDVLRERGEEAYFYHGPNRSSVLINAWTHAEAFTSVVGRADRYSNTVRTVQERYPHNVPNGRPFTASDDPEYVRSQHSFLVPIR